MLLFLMGFFGSFSDPGVTAQSIEAEAAGDPRQHAAMVERIAHNLPFIDWHTYVRRTPLEYARPWPEHPEVVQMNDLLAALYRSADTAPPGADDHVCLLLHDGDPRVRMVAMLWLHQRFNPVHLPAIHELLQDREAGVPAFLDLRSSFMVDRPFFGTHAWAVGQAAYPIIYDYIHRLGDPVSVADFPAYWAARSGRDFCLSWIEIEFEGRGAFKRVIVDHESIRQRLASLPGLDNADRPIYHMAIVAHQPHWNGGTPVLEPDLLRSVGRERLLDLLELKPVIDDPDLPYYLDAISAAVLRDETGLFTAGDADRLMRAMTQERFPRHLVHRYAAAAARLDPDHARLHLTRALRLLWLEDHAGAAVVAAELSAIASEDEQAAIRTWFYVTRQETMQSMRMQSGFLDAVFKRQLTDLDKRVLAGIIADPRFDGADWHVLLRLMRHAGREFSILRDRDFEAELTLPEAVRTGRISWADFQRQFPEQSKAPVARLASWKVQLRALTKAWLDPSRQVRRSGMPRMAQVSFP